MPDVQIICGRQFGKAPTGLNQRASDFAQAPQEAAEGKNWIISRGTIQGRKGLYPVKNFTRPTSYYATWAANGSVRFPYTSSYDGMFEARRYSHVFSFRTPAVLPASGWLYSKRVEISSTDFTCGVKVDSTGKVTVAVCDSARADKSFDSGVNVLLADTNYVLQVVRYDANAYLYWGTPTSTPALKATTDALGRTDHPVDEGSGGHPIIIGGDHTGVAYTGETAIEAHEFTAVRKVLNHTDFGFTSYADPLSPDVMIHCRFEDASGNFTDLSSHGNDSDDENNITYQQTTNAFVEESALVCGVFEFTTANLEERIVEVVDGSISASDYHV